MRQLTETQQKVYDFVAEQHGTQVRKYTGEPYVNHCLEVAELVYKYVPSEFLWTIAMCHDLLEDTTCTLEILTDFLESLGFNSGQSSYIAFDVNALSDEFTVEKYPQLNRLVRKANEAVKLGNCERNVHTIKYADIISNTRSIAAYDSKFALTYLPGKVQLLHYMRKGDINLYIQACAEVYEGLRSVGLLENYKFSL